MRRLWLFLDFCRYGPSFWVLHGVYIFIYTDALVPHPRDLGRSTWPEASVTCVLPLLRAHGCSAPAACGASRNRAQRNGSGQRAERELVGTYHPAGSSSAHYAHYGNMVPRKLEYAPRRWRARYVEPMQMVGASTNSPTTIATCACAS